MTKSIQIIRTKASRLPTVDFNHLEFGKVPTDHMFVVRYAGGAWQEPRIEPFADLRLSPFALVLHYAQTIFEGLKAFRMDDGRINVFRPERNAERLNQSAVRMCMPTLPAELFLEGMDELLRIDEGWVPPSDKGSLYLRPLMFATEPKIGVKAADEYLFLILASPVGDFYDHPLRVRVETHFVRAAKGGTGAAKCGGNYAGSLYPAMLAKKDGYDQVLWTDGRNHEFLEESGTMNVGFIIDGKLITPPLSDSILPGITRDSVLTLAPALDLETEEYPITVAELEDALRSGRLTEGFGIGTAAVITPFREIAVGDHHYPLTIREDSTAYRIKSYLNDLRMGRRKDPYGWNHIVSL